MRTHPILRTKRLHAGWDLAIASGSPVMAAADGVVEKAGWGGGYGNLIIIRHGKLQTRYAHLSKILVKNGQRVSRGDMIGKVGTTGLSTGPHLHFEQRSASGGVIKDRPNEQLLAEFLKGKKRTQLAEHKPVVKAARPPVQKALVAKKKVVAPKKAQPQKLAVKPKKKKPQARRPAPRQPEWHIFSPGFSWGQ